MGAGSELFKMAINPLYGIARLIKYGNNPDDPDNADFSQIANTVKGVWNDWTGNTANRENIEYQQQYNQEVFNRADTEYQRTVAGLRKAGLSAQLAVGAPSSVGGAAQAPQRTVGNESAAIERLVGLVNAIKQTNSNIALASAQADQAKANAKNADADTNLKNLEAGTYTERYLLDMQLGKADLEYKNALTFIAQQEGQTTSAKIQAQIDNLNSSTSYNNKLIELAQSNIELNDAKISESSAQKGYIRELTEKVKQEKANLVQEFSNKVKEGLRLDASTSLLVQQALNAKIEGDILQYNFDTSKDQGLRTTDQISRFMGINLGLDAPVKKFTDWFRNYKGIGGVFPSWNELFSGF